MKSIRHLLTGTLSVACVALSATSLSEPTHQRFGAEKSFDPFIEIQLKNFHDENLGRITDLGLDLVNGRIVEVLVVIDSSLASDRKIVAVPPKALLPDLRNEIYRLDVSTEAFLRAPAIDLQNWAEAGRSARVAAAYRHFNQEPYFLEEGDVASQTAARPKVPLGYVERANRIMDLPVGNPQGERFGKVWSLTFDITRGLIRSVIIIAPGNFRTKSVVPPTALRFNDARDGLLLDDTKSEFADEPRYLFTAAAFGNKAYYHEESYQGPHTLVALEQGRSYSDIDTTLLINRDIDASKINRHTVQVGTFNGRVTLRGWVDTAEDKRRIGEIAISAARLTLVDNQLSIGKPVTSN